MAAAGTLFEAGSRGLNTSTEASRPWAPEFPIGLLWLPALGVAARYYTTFGDALRTRGIALETVEWRGTGLSPLRAGHREDWGYRELLIDAEQALLDVQQKHPGRAWMVGGHSMGGQLAALLAATTGGDLSMARPARGLVLVATGVPHWRFYRGRMRWGIRAFTSLLPALTSVVGHFPGSALRFAGREARGVMRDWRHSAVTGRYAAAGVELDFEAALKSLELPVCAIALENDALAPPESLRALLAKMPGAEPFERVLGATHLGVRADHFGWLRQPDAIVVTIASWALHHGIWPSTPQVAKAQRRSR